ncbi:MAG TPA: protein kinase, partial [Baekduia sp.]|nr:protein kinase [Baekduia sp.]
MLNKIEIRNYRGFKEFGVEFQDGVNILVDADGVPKLVDFGVAGLLEAVSESPATVAQTRSRPLTPEYASPELLRGEPVNTAADVYSLGVVLYEAVTLRRPFAGPSSVALTRAIRTERPPDAHTQNPALPRDLSVVLATALEKEPSRRYATALELAEELRRVREFEPILARPVGVFGRLARWSRRHPAVAAVTGGSILVPSLALGAALV